MCPVVPGDSSIHLASMPPLGSIQREDLNALKAKMLGFVEAPGDSAPGEFVGSISVVTYCCRHIPLGGQMFLFTSRESAKRGRASSIQLEVGYVRLRKRKAGHFIICMAQAFFPSHDTSNVRRS